jgi:hypothetical protein
MASSATRLINGRRLWRSVVIPCFSGQQRALTTTTTLTTRTSTCSRTSLRRHRQHGNSPTLRFLSDVSNNNEKKSNKPPNLLVKAGLPFVLFSVLASWVVSNALDGKLKEQETSQGKASISLRQAKLAQEQAKKAQEEAKKQAKLAQKQAKLAQKQAKLAQKQAKKKHKK